jgi:nitrite reductase (NADH) large subunit
VEDAVKIRTQAVDKKSAVLIGGGLLGLEAGYALTRLGLHVVVVEAAPWLLPRQVDEEGSILLQEKLIPLGFEFYVGATVSHVRTIEGKVTLVLGSGAELNTDLVVLSAGIRPRTELVVGTDIQVKRGILVDDRMQTQHPDIWAAGDVAEWHGGIAGLWAASQAMGRVAGINAAGGDAVYPGLAPSTTLKVAGVEVCSQGDIRLPQAEILLRREAGYWVKLFLNVGRVVGSIQIGRTTGATSFKKIMDRKLDITGFESELLQDGFDFKRIPGFDH